MLGLLRGGANLVANLLQDVLRCVCVWTPGNLVANMLFLLLLDVLHFFANWYFFSGKPDFMVERWWDPKDTSSLEM